MWLKPLFDAKRCIPRGGELYQRNPSSAVLFLGRSVMAKKIKSSVTEGPIVACTRPIRLRQ